MSQTVRVRCARCGALFAPHEDQAATLRQATVVCPHCLAVLLVDLPGEPLPPK